MSEKVNAARFFYGSLRLVLIKICAIPSWVYCNYLFVRISYNLQKNKPILMKKNCCRGGEARLEDFFFICLNCTVPK